jgi:hypothetical protein
MALKTEFADPWGQMDRMKAAEALAKVQDAISPIGFDQFSVKSQSSGNEYVVDLKNCTCTCGDFRYRGECKHLLAVMIEEFSLERARVLHDFLRNLKFERDSAVSTSKVCPNCTSLTKLVEIKKLPLQGPLAEILEVYEKTSQCPRCGHTTMVRIPTKRRAAEAS